MKYIIEGIPRSSPRLQARQHKKVHPETHETQLHHHTTYDIAVGTEVSTVHSWQCIGQGHSVSAGQARLCSLQNHSLADKAAVDDVGKVASLSSRLQQLYAVLQQAAMTDTSRAAKNKNMCITPCSCVTQHGTLQTPVVVGLSHKHIVCAHPPPQLVVAANQVHHNIIGRAWEGLFKPAGAHRCTAALQRIPATCR